MAEMYVTPNHWNNKKNNKKNNISEKSKPIKIPSTVICPKCGEKYLFYISKNGKRKGILFGEYFHEGFFDSHYGECYDCYTCGHHWDTRTSEIPLSIRIFPFLQNK